MDSKFAPLSPANNHHPRHPLSSAIEIKARNDIPAYLVYSTPAHTSIYPLPFTHQDHNGGALKVELDAVGVFEGTVAFTNISTIPADTGVRRYVKGAALHSKVRARLH